MSDADGLKEAAEKRGEKKIMDDFEKVELLKGKANVSYEDARDALKASGGDILEAMIYLENLGKTAEPEHASFSTSYEEQDDYEKVEETVYRQQEKARQSQGSVKRFLKKAWRFLVDNSFCVARKGETVFKLPILVLAVAFLVNWKLLLAVLVVALFFSCRYTLEGKADLENANDLMGKASDVADQIKKEFTKKH